MGRNGYSLLAVLLLLVQFECLLCAPPVIARTRDGLLAERPLGERPPTPAHSGSLLAERPPTPAHSGSLLAERPLGERPPTPAHSGSRILDAALRAMHGGAKEPPQKHPWDDKIKISDQIVGYDIIMTAEQIQFFRNRENETESEAESETRNETESEDESDTRRRYKRKAISSQQYHWDNGIIPYIMDESVVRVSPWAPYVLHAAMKHWMAFTCIRFQPYNPHKHGRWANRLQFSRGTWCSSHLGKTGGLQYLFIHPSCLTRGTIIHELGHTIGWFHEHARPDRDQFVQVRWHRVDNQTKEQYLKEREFVINTYGIQYDYRSIMHYPNHNGELMTLDRRFQHLIGQREGLSFLDQKLANKMYKCSAHCPATLTCREPGFMNKDCECVCQDGTDLCRVTSEGHVTSQPTGREVDDEEDYEGNDLVSPADRFVDSDECYWRYKTGMAPSVKVKVRKEVSSVDECKLRCLQARDFSCRSFHYVYKRFLWYTISSDCLLSEEWAKDRRFEPTHDGASAIYYETPSCLQNRNFCGWEKTESLLITVDDEDGKVNYNLDLNECKLTCLEEQDFHCQSFLFKRFLSGNTVCVHTKTTKERARSTEPYRSVDYYARRGCGGLEPSTADNNTTVTSP